MPNTPPTYERVATLLRYDPETGLLTWRPRSPGEFTTARAHSTWTARYCGAEAGAKSCADGYISVPVGGRRYKGHRLAWLLHYGAWPQGEVDHINCQRQDNRIVNLRDVSGEVNCQNRRTHRCDSQTKLIGAFPCVGSGGYFSKIKVKGKQVYLGRFDTPESAHRAYIAAKRQLHEGNTL